MTEDKKKIISDYMAFLGSKGGRVTGASKARSSEQARAAVAERWKRYRAHKAEMAKNGSANGNKR